MTAEQAPQSNQPVFVNNVTTTVVVGHRRTHPLLAMIGWLLVACYWWPLLLCIAFYGYLVLGAAWLVAPVFAETSTSQRPELTAEETGAAAGRGKVAESTERFTAWLGKASLLNR